MGDKSNSNSPGVNGLVKPTNQPTNQPVNQTKPNETKPNETKPNETKQNQEKTVKNFKKQKTNKQTKTLIVSK